MQLLRASSIAWLIALPGCSSGSEHATSPIWSNAPSTPIALRTGISETLDLHVENQDESQFEVRIDPVDGIDVIVEESALRVRASYAARGDARFGVTLAGSGGSTRYDIDVRIEPLSVREHAAWAKGDGPAAREHGTFFFDEQGKQAFLLYGSGYEPQFEDLLSDAWRFVPGQGFQRIEPKGEPPPPAGSRRVAWVESERAAYLYGGYGGEKGREVLQDLYRARVEGESLTIEKIEQVNAPPARSLHAFVYDPPSQTFALFGGFGGSALGVQGDTWTMRIEGGKAVWTEHVLVESPEPRYGSFYGYDAESRRMVVFSGARAPTAKDPIRAAADTWTLDLSGSTPVWRAIEVEGAPPGRRNGFGVVDPEGGRLLVMGGTSNGQTTEPGLFFLDLSPGHERWEEANVDSLPAWRSSGFGAAGGGALWMGFGNGSAIHRDLFALGYAVGSK